MNQSDQPNSATTLDSLDLPEIEKVAEHVHNFWVAQKIQQGIFSHRSRDGEELMVPYDMLSEPAKDLDRNTVRGVYGAIVVLNNAKRIRKSSPSVGSGTPIHRVVGSTV